MEQVIKKSETTVSPQKAEEPQIRVYITLADEKTISPEQKHALEEMREIFAEWNAECEL